jgi:hypothetical protein
MTSKSPVRACEDVDEATLSYAEVKALCAGNPLIKEKIDLDVSVAKLKALKANHVNEQYRLEDNVLKYFPEAIKKTENRIKGYESDFEHLKSVPAPEDGKMSPMTIMGTEFTEKEAAGKVLIEACKTLKAKETLDVGGYKGFDIAVSYDSFHKNFILELKRDMSYTTTLGADPIGNITRINNLLNSISNELEYSKSQLETLGAQLETAKEELGKPFPREDELNTKMTRLTELNIILNIEGKQEFAAIEKLDIAADKPPTAADRVADKPKSPKSIYAKMKYFKEEAAKEAQGVNPKLKKEAELH